MPTPPTKSSTPATGAGATAGILRDAKAQVESARTEEARQLSLLGPPSPEAMAEAQARLGPRAGELAVVAEARKGAGRPRGVRNRRTEDFRRYILAMGRHPAVTLMEIVNTPPEVLVARSKALDPPKRRMNYGDAQSLRVRCAEGLMPYVESKMPVAVDFTAEGDFNLIIPGFNVSEKDAAALAAGQFVLDAEYSEVDEEEGHAPG